MLQRKTELIKQVLRDGGPGFCQFAITNACNAHCDFCSFARERLPAAEQRSVPLEDACRSVDILARNGVGYLIFVGGEPFMHPDLYTLIAHAHERDLNPMVCTNGSFLTEKNIERLATAGLSSCIISIDAATAAAHEQNRGLPGVCERIRAANTHLRERGIQSTASVTASRLIDDYAALPPFLRSLGFESVTFSYPLTTLPSSYLSYSDSGLVDYTPEELEAVFGQIKRLKRQFHVVNPSASLTDMQRHLRGERERFPCLAGNKYFYLDWNLDLYRCHYWEKPLCAIDQFDGTQRVRDDCTRCMIDCYRDPSVLQHIAVSLSNAAGFLRRGELLAGMRALFHRENAVSIAAVLEERRWIRHV